MKTLPPVRELERAYQASDADYDGIFVLGVRTTGIFCRPSCRARKPKPENVEYFATVREALFAGYRPCKRCRPLSAPGTPPAWLESLLKEIDSAPALRIRDADLRARGIDPARARRYFHRNYGMTFQAYCRSRRMGSALEEIRRGTKLDDIVVRHGYESHSGFRDAFRRTFKSPPGQSNASQRILLSWITSPLGALVAAASDAGVCLLEFTERRMLEAQFETLGKRFRCPMVPGENEHLARLRDELADYFAGTLRSFSVPLVYPGSPFQRRVWDELLHIPYGHTQSYEELALRVGSPGAQRAVGHANGLNRIAILIPCHRVVNKNGKLGGYGGGLWRKQFLLDLEKSNR